MKTRSKTLEDISRRKFAKMIAAAVVAAPLAVQTPGQQKKGRRQRPAKPGKVKIFTHIPPIDMMNGSFIIRSGEPLDDDIANDLSMAVRPRRHKCLYNEVKWVRILAANGDWLFDGYNNTLADRARIDIWFAGDATSDASQVSIRKEVSSPHITFETKKKLASETGSSGSFPYRRKYSDTSVQIKYVSVTKPGSPAVVIPSNEKQQIEHILVWTYD